VKASNGDLDHITETLYRLGPLRQRVALLSGDDSLTLPIMALGGSGVISVAANIMPAVMSDLVRCCANLANPAALSKARILAQSMSLFCRALLKGGGSPAQTKAVMGRLGLPAGNVRLPLVPLDEAGTSTLLEQLQILLRNVDAAKVHVDLHLRSLL
jgi:4-hydroxy-tetrahydrodipicolinate synthase